VNYAEIPVKNPKNQTVIAALFLGTNLSQLPMVASSETVNSLGGFYAIYAPLNEGKYVLVSGQNVTKNQLLPDLQWMDRSLLISARATDGKPVAQQIKIGNQTYTVAAKSLKFSRKTRSNFSPGHSQNLDRNLVGQQLVAAGTVCCRRTPRLGSCSHPPDCQTS